MPSFIADGYEFGSGFYPIDKVHDGIEVFHRPMTPADSAQFQFESGQERGVKLRAVQADWLLKKIIRWQMPKGADGKRPEVPKLTKELLVSGDNGMVIDSTLLSQMIATVIWGDAPDYRIGDSPQDAEKN